MKNLKISFFYLPHSYTENNTIQYCLCSVILEGLFKIFRYVIHHNHIAFLFKLPTETFTTSQCQETYGQFGRVNRTPPTKSPGHIWL